MKKLMENLKNWQQIVIATFFGLLGAGLWIWPFYVTGKEMSANQETKFTELHWLFILFGTIAIALSLRLSRIDKLFNLGTGVLSKIVERLTGKQTKDNDNDNG